ncbi:MAG: hypothetical protein SGJ10_02115 [Bacteroidota bacterium]|nr:hypothetical protein [Bacteroidota bacterium]
MKIIKTAILALTISNIAQAQSLNATIALHSIDCRSSTFETQRNQVADMVLIELERSSQYEVMDKYELEYKIKNDSTNQYRNCYSTSCLSLLGEQLGVSQLLTGNIKNMGGQIIITLKIWDIREKKFAKVEVSEFLDINTELRKMLQISMNNLLGIKNDTLIVSKLTKPNDFANELNNPYQLRLRSDGPRMGFAAFAGEKGNRLKAKPADGGYNLTPVMFQFGYQFEKQYLNSGNFQALFEFVPMITGLDQGKAFVSLVIMNGLRNNKNGWEIAFGPSLTVAKFAYGYYDAAGNWTLGDNFGMVSSNNIIRRLDSRGTPQFTSSFVIAAGRTFKSGKLNIPLNAYIVPSRHSVQFGLSFGFNSRDRYEPNKK